MDRNSELQFEMDGRGEVIFRDDDVFWDFSGCAPCNADHHYDFQEFVWWDRMFEERNVKHVCSCICGEMDNRPELVKYIKDHPHIEVQIHGWQHKPYYQLSYEECYEDFKKSKETIEKIFGKTPKIYYPTWNKVGIQDIKAAGDLGLEVRKEHIGVLDYASIQDGEFPKHREINWHFWAEDNNRYISICLDKYVDRRNKGYYWDKEHQQCNTLDTKL